MAQRPQIIYDKQGKDTGEAYGPDEKLIPWALRQGAIGLGETPGTFAALYGLLSAADEYTAMWGRDPNKGFKEHLYTPEGLEKLKEYNANVMNDLRQTYPDLSEEDINAKFDTIQKHGRKYYQDTSEFMRPGIAFSRRWSQKVNDYLGDPRLPTEKTQGDQLMNIVGGAIPAPGGGGIARLFGSVGARVAANPVGRAAINAAEIATPLTLYPEGATAGQIAGRVGLNVGLGETIDQTARIAEGQPSVVRDAAQLATQNDDGTYDWKKVATTGALATLLGGLALKNLTKIRGAVQGGPARETMTNAAYPEPNLKVAQSVSDVEPMMKHASIADVGDLEGLRVKLEGSSTVSARTAHDLWADDNLWPIVSRFTREDPEFQQRFQQHIADRARIYGDETAIKEVEAQITRYTQLYQRAANANTPNPATVNRLSNTLNDLMQERQARLQDRDPNLRYSLMDEDRNTVRQRLQQSSQDPKIQAAERQLGKLYDDIVDVSVNEGLVSAASGNRWKASIRRGNYSMSENPFVQKNWFQNLRDKASKWTDTHLVFANPEEALALYRGITNKKVRMGYEDANGKTRYINPQPDWRPEPRTNNPTDPFTELQFLSVRARQAAAANNTMKEYFTAMKNAPGNAGGKFVREVRRYPEKSARFVADKVIAQLEKKGRPYSNAYYDKGDLVVIEHNSRVIRDTFKFAPATVVPILNQSRKVFQANTTGSLNPAFALISTPWDVVLGHALRNPQMVFGPISRLAAEATGRGSLAARYISAVATPVDLAYNLAKLPAVAAKRVLLETMGNQLGKKWQADLAMNSGVIGNMARLPGIGPVLNGVVDGMVKAYQNSWTHAMKAMKVGHAANYSDEILDHLRRLDKLGKNYPMYKSAWSGYKAILSVLHDTPKEMFLSQNINLYRRELRRGKQMAQHMNEEFIANEARKIGGDFARKSGNPYIQGALSTIPYGNTILQSMRYVGARVRDNGAEGVARLASMGMAVTALYQYVSQYPELSDWFFNQLPPEQRAQILPIPNPIRYARRMMGENVPIGTPQQEIIPVRMPPEMMPFVLPIMHGLMALGFIKTPQTQVPPSISNDFGAIMDQSFGITLPPLMQGAAAAFGKKIDPTKLFHGESPFRDIRDFTFAGANRNKMSPDSNIPHAFHDVFNAMFGTVTGSILQAANYGDIVAAKTGSKLEGVTEGVKKFGVDRAASTPYAAHIWPEVNRRFVYTPVLQKLSEDMSVLRQVDQQFSNEPGLRMIAGRGRTNTVDYLRAQEGTSVGMPVQDDDVRAILFNVHQALFSGSYLKLTQERAKARRLHESLTVGVNRDERESPLLRFQKAQEQAKEVNRLDQELYSQYQDVWKDIQGSPSGKAFARKFGPLTPERLLDVVRQDAQTATRQPY